MCESVKVHLSNQQKKEFDCRNLLKMTIAGFDKLHYTRNRGITYIYPSGKLK